MLQFEWDDAKNAANLRKHGISFSEAKTAFMDQDALIRSDPDHSEEEDRFILPGFSEELHLLIVCHCYRQKQQVIRIISARKASKTEYRYYFQREW